MKELIVDGLINGHYTLDYRKRTVRLYVWVYDHRLPLGWFFQWNDKTGFSLKAREWVICRIVGHLQPTPEEDDAVICQRCFRDVSAKSAQPIPKGHHLEAVRRAKDRPAGTNH